MRKYILFVIMIMALVLTGCPKASAPTPPLPPTTVPPVVESPTPTPIVYSLTDIQNTIAKTCGTCGDTGGPAGTAVANYHQTLNVSDAPLPNSGHTAMFDIAAVNPYGNGYWYWPHTPPVDNNVEFIYEFNMYFSSAAKTASQAIEWEMQLDDSNVVYNYAYQLNWRENLIKTFDKLKHAWIPTKFNCDLFTPDTWHHIIMHNKFDAKTKTLTIETLMVDLHNMDINVMLPAPATTQAGRHFTNAFQLDSNGKTPPTPYHVYIDRMRINYYANTN